MRHVWCVTSGMQDDYSLTKVFSSEAKARAFVEEHESKYLPLDVERWEVE